MVNIVDYAVAQGVIVRQDGHWQVQDGLQEIAIDVPDSLRRMIELQIDRLSPEEQRVLTAASVAGIEFSAAAVAAALEADVAQVEEWCESLVRSHLFLRSRNTYTGPERRRAARYRFLHSLYHSLAYERLPLARRRQLHQRIGEWKETSYDGRANEIAAELAVHFEQGWDYLRTVRYRKQAAETATKRHAYQEAMHALTRGLELLATLPDTPSRAQQELDLQIALGSAVMAVKGYGAPEAAAAYARARELCRQVGETPQLVPILTGLGRYYLLRAELATARELAEQSLMLAQRVQDVLLLLEAHRSMIAVLFWLGAFSLARTYIERAIPFYNSGAPHRSPPSRAVQDPQVSCLSFAAVTLWVLGYPEQAWQKSRDAVHLAQHLAHPFSLAYALNWAAIFHHARREPQLAQERAEAARCIAAEHGFAQMLAQSMIFRGWALAVQGQEKEGMAQIQQGLAALRATGAELGLPYCLALSAEVHGQVGQPTEGLRVLTEALAIASRSQQRAYAAELYRLQGELTLQKRQVPGSKLKATDPRSLMPNAQAEACFRKAIAIARRQKAKALELRATLSLGRLWRQQGKGKNARQALVTICCWFSEGLETPDLQAARAFLKEGT
jgi:predicted ATPase